MTNRQAGLWLAALVLLAALYSALLYPTLPERIPSHWNIHGEVDGWMRRTAGAIFGPVLVAVLGMLLYLLPWLSPRHFKVDLFRGTYNYVVVLVAGLIFFIHLVSLQAALHPAFDWGRVLIGGIFLLIALVGNVLGKVRRNFWMGVRTPWTLASDAVWIATHRLAARIWVSAGIAGALALWLGVPAALCVALWMVAILFPVFYSLFLYKRLEREGEA
jgi:uncharacterized membrane protein